MSWLDAFFNFTLRIRNAGVQLIARSALNFVSGFTLVDNPATGAIDVTNAPTAIQVLAALAGQDLGSLTLGPAYQTATKATTVGGASTTLISAPIPANWAALFRLEVIGWSSTVGLFAETLGPGSVELTGGTPSTITGTGYVTSSISQTGLPCLITPSYSGGALSVLARGPLGNITAAADNGSGKVRLTVDGPLDSTLTGQSVTIAGLTTCTEANGAHIATQVDATHFDLTSVALVHTGADAGTAVYTTPPTMKWAAWIRVIVP